MAIKMVYEPLHKQGEPDITRPAVICDECGEEIKAAEEGMYLFDGRLKHEDYWLSKPIDLYTVHKNYGNRRNYLGCWDRFVERMGWDTVTDGELSWLPVYLANTLGVDYAEEEASLREMP